MLRMTRESDKQNRIIQVTNLYNHICVEHPVRIDLNKVNEPIQLINLAWILAIIRKKCNSFSDINFDDLALNAMAEVVRRNLIDTLQYSGKLVDLNAKYFDEANFTSLTYEKKLSYKLPSDIVILLLSEDPIFKKFLVNGLPERQNMPDGAEGEIGDESKSSAGDSKLTSSDLTKKSKKKASPIRRILMESLVEHLVKKTEYNTYKKFFDLMTNDYLYRNGENKTGYNEHDKIQNVYCVRAEPKESKKLKYPKYIIHFSVLNDADGFVPKKSYSLSSLKKIFDDTQTKLKQKLKCGNG